MSSPLPPQQNGNYVKGMLTNLIVAVLSQHTHILNHHIIHSAVCQLYLWNFFLSLM